jgi:hypothetical protein
MEVLKINMKKIQSGTIRDLLFNSYSPQYCFTANVYAVDMESVLFESHGKIHEFPWRAGREHADPLLSWSPKSLG